MAIRVDRNLQHDSRRPEGVAGRSGIGVTADGAALGTGYSDHTVVERAREAGQLGLQGPDWGDNRADLFLIREITDTSRVHEGVVGIDLAGRVANREAQIEQAAIKKDAAIHGAVESVREKADATAEADRISARISADQLAIPAERRNIGRSPVRLPSALAVVLAVIGGGDLITIALGFQPFGLSDKPIAGTPLTQLYLAAISSVVALLLLAEQLGVHLSLLSHTLRHRSDPDGAAGDESISPRTRADAIDVAKMVGCAVGCGLVLYALSWMRTSYAALLSPLASDLATPFLLLQIGIVLAATIFAAHHAHPYAKHWSATQQRLTRALRDYTRAMAAATRAVAYYNSLLPGRDAEIAKALHLCSAVTEEAARQGKLAAGTITLSQPEPVADRLFPDGLPAPTHTAYFDDLTGYSAGAPSPFRRYEPADLQAICDAEQAAAEDRSKRQRHAR